MRFKIGDKVIIIAGKDKGNTGLISKVIGKDNKVIVGGQNLIKKHVKPNANNQNGGIISMEAPIDASNVMFADEKNKRSRTRKIIEKKKETKPKKVEVKKPETKTKSPKTAKVK